MLADTDCNDPLSRCELIQTNPRGPCFGIGYVAVPPVFEARCIRGCREDSDCGDGLVCVREAYLYLLERECRSYSRG